MPTRAKKLKKPEVKNFLGLAKKYYQKYRHEWPMIILISALVLFFLLVFSYTSGFLGSSAEKNFNKARGSFDSNLEEVVSMTNQSKEALGAIEKERQAGNYDAVLQLVAIESERNNNVKEKGYVLPADLKVIAENLGNLQPVEAIQIGLRAIEKGLNAFETSTNYTSYTDDYLEAAKKWAGGERTAEASENIENKLSLSIKRAEKLNTLAEDYKKLMAEFDNARK